MRFEETQLWEIVLPKEVPYSEWLVKVNYLATGHMLYNESIKGYWGDIPEDSRVFRIACSETSIKKICYMTANTYNQNCVMCYRISNHCLLGYKDET